MAIWGKIIGGAAGMMFGGPLGALLGVAGGHFWDKGVAASNQSSQTSVQQVAFSTAVIAMMAKMAKADGHVSREEIRAFKKIFRYQPEDEMAVRDIYREAQTSAEGFHDYAHQITDILGSGSRVLEELLWALAEIARADGRLHERELNLLRDGGRIFGLSPEAFARIAALEQEGDNKNPYTILGIAEGASNEEIKRHYRGLVRELHPDRLIAEGLPEEVIETSGRKLAAINEAYDRIAEARGIR